MIKNKRQMYRLLNSGKLGNTFHSWDSWQEVLDSGYRGHLSVRSMTVSDPIRIYDVEFDEVQRRMKKIRRTDLVFYEASPRKSRLLQGELMRSEKGLALLGTYVKEPMRIALEQSMFQVYGLEAVLHLKNNTDDYSYEHLQFLLDSYPGAVVEFTTFNKKVGQLRQRLIIWEVRNY